MWSKNLSKFLSRMNHGWNRLLLPPLSSYFKFQKLKYIAPIRSVSTVDSNSSLISKSFSFSASVSNYRRYMLDNPKFHPIVFNIEKFDHETESHLKSLNILKNLIGLTKSEDLEQEANYQKELEEHFVEDVKSFTTEDICKSIYLMSRWQFLKGGESCTETLATILDEELFSRKFDKSEMLKILYVCHECLIRQDLKINKFHYLHKAELKLFFKITSLSPQQTVLLFYCIRKKLNFDIDKYLVLSHITKNMQEFNSDELGIIAKGLLKINNLITHLDFTETLLAKIQAEVDNINSISFEAVCKFLHKFLKAGDLPKVLDFQEQVIPHFSKFPEDILITLLFTSMRFKTVNLNAWNKIIHRIKENIQDCSLFDIERMLKVHTSCNIKDVEFLTLAINEFEKNENVLEVPHVLINFLIHLIHNRMHSRKLLDVVLSQDFYSQRLMNLKKKGNTHKISYHWWCLYCHAEMEIPEFNSFKLNEADRLSLYKVVRYNVEHNDEVDDFFPKAFGKLKHGLEALYGNEKIHKDICLPHNCKVIVMRFDKKLQAHPIPEDFKLKRESYAKQALQDGYMWVSLVLTPTVNFVGNDEELKLPSQTKYRQLKALGYVPIMMNGSLVLRHIHEQTFDTYFKSLLEKALKMNLDEEEKIQSQNQKL